MKTSALLLGICLTVLALSNLEAQEILLNFIYVARNDPVTGTDRSYISTIELNPAGPQRGHLRWRCVDDRSELVLGMDKYFVNQPTSVTWEFTPVGGGAGFEFENDTTQTTWMPSDDHLELIAGPEVGQFSIQALGASHVTLRATDFNDTEHTYEFRLDGITAGFRRLGCVDRMFGMHRRTDEHLISQDGFKVVSISMRVTERNQIWWRYAWRLTIRNTTRASVSLDATIEFHDSGGFVIDDDTEYGLTIKAGAQETFTGFALINLPGARNVQSVIAKIEKS